MMKIFVTIVSIILLGRAIRKLWGRFTIIGVGEALVWISVATFSLFPEITRTISSYLNFGENLNTLIFLGFVFVFIVLFSVLERTEGLKKDIADLARAIAIRSGRESNKDNK